MLAHELRNEKGGENEASSDLNVQPQQNSLKIKFYLAI